LPISSEALRTLVVRARRRHILQLLAVQTAYSASIGLGGFILLLFLGTQVLDWYWPVLLFTISFGIGVVRFRSRILPAYRIAQQIDQRLGLDDSLSTAFYFLDPDNRLFDPAVRDRQRQQAEDQAAVIAPAQAMPFSFPRAALAAAVLALGAAVLFGVRYGVMNGLDLSKPMVAMAFDLFQSQPEEVAQRKGGKRPEQDIKGIGEHNEGPDKAEQLDPASQQALGTIEVPDVDQGVESGDKGRESQKRSPDPSAEPSEEGEQAEGMNAGDDQQPSGQDTASGENKGGQKSKQDDSKSGRQGNGENENSSLLDKMRDAFANLMNKMNIKPKGGDQQAANQKSGQQSPASRQQQSQKGQQMPGKQTGDGQQGEEQQGDPQGEGGEKSESAQGKSGDQSDQQAAKDAKSGMGKQDGNKDTQLAEQLSAMGKISEIIGKRAQNIQGEVMVEVSSGRQQLKTPYSQKKGKHADLGGEIHRDEIPLIYQDYVQQYFEQVRKQAPAAK